MILRGAVGQDLAELRRIPAGDFPDRFFQVELRGIIRHRNDQLLSAAAVNSYLAQVGPVPFREDFPFRDKILGHIGAHVRLGNLSVVIGEGSTPVCRPHTSRLEIGAGAFDAFTDVELLNIEGIGGEPACVGWVLHHGDYRAPCPSPAAVKRKVAMALRQYLQVRDDRMFEELFPESRFNAWSVGELHVIDPRVIPNGRRDYFEQSVHFNNLQTHLTPVAREITRRCRTSSIQRKLSRDFELREITVREKAAIIKQGALSRQDRYKLTEEIKVGVAFLAGIITKGSLPPQVLAEFSKRKEKLERDVSKVLDAPFKASPLSEFPSSKRHACEQLIALIYECSPSRANAKLLVDKILARIT